MLAIHPPVRRIPSTLNGARNERVSRIGSLLLDRGTSIFPAVLVVVVIVHGGGGGGSSSLFAAGLPGGADLAGALGDPGGLGGGIAGGGSGRAAGLAPAELLAHLAVHLLGDAVVLERRLGGDVLPLRFPVSICFPGYFWVCFPSVSREGGRWEIGGEGGGRGEEGCGLTLILG